eukprot:757313_1
MAEEEDFNVQLKAWGEAIEKRFGKDPWTQFVQVLEELNEELDMFESKEDVSDDLDFDDWMQSEIMLALHESGDQHTAFSEESMCESFFMVFKTIVNGKYEDMEWDVDEKDVKEPIEDQLQLKFLACSQEAAMTFGYNAHFPYLPYLCDVFLRQYHDYSENDYTTPEQWMIYYEHEHLTHLQDEELTRAIRIAVRDYFKRVLPRMIIPQPTKIVDSLAVVSAHVLMFCDIVKRLSSELATAPFQLELCFTLRSVDCDADYTDDDIGDIRRRLNNGKLQYQTLNIHETYDLRKSIMDAFNIVTKGNYQQKRLVALIDRRSKVNKLYLYESSRGYVPVATNSTTQAYMNNARHILIPPDISCVSQCYGNLLTFSFHVRHENDVRCYMHRYGEIMRFMPADVTGKVMAQLFIDDSTSIQSKNNAYFVHSEAIASLVQDTKYSLANVQFERFCQDIKIFAINAKDRYKHVRPKAYNYDDEDDDCDADCDDTAPRIDDDLQNILRPQFDSKMNLMQYFFTLFHANFRDNTSLCKLTAEKLKEFKLKAFHQLELIRRIEKLKKKKRSQEHTSELQSPRIIS